MRQVYSLPTHASVYSEAARPKLARSGCRSYLEGEEEEKKKNMRRLVQMAAASGEEMATYIQCN